MASQPRKANVRHERGNVCRESHIALFVYIDSQHHLNKSSNRGRCGKLSLAYEERMLNHAVASPRTSKVQPIVRESRRDCTF